VQTGEGWRDFVGVFLKDEKNAELHTDRILDKKRDIENGYLYPNFEVLYNHNPF
jgi:hypothetical protein